jgi:hypothetical protein
MTCAEILAKIVSLRSAILSDEGDLKELQSEAAGVNKTLLQKTEQKLQDDKKQLASLLAAREPCFVKQPQDILQIQFNNPEPPADFSATVIAGGTFPSLSEGQEWVPVLGPKEEDYEGPNMVGATGWALNPDFSGADLPFTHPFGFDWEFSVRLTNRPPIQRNTLFCSLGGTSRRRRKALTKTSNRQTNSIFRSLWGLTENQAFLASKSTEIWFRINSQTRILDWSRVTVLLCSDVGSSMQVMK